MKTGRYEKVGGRISLADAATLGLKIGNAVAAAVFGTRGEWRRPARCPHCHDDVPRFPCDRCSYPDPTPGTVR